MAFANMAFANMAYTCCVPSCRNISTEVKMHLFPKSDKIFNKWLIKIANPQLQETDPDSVRTMYRVCDVHFNDDSRLRGRSGANLKADSIPTLHLPMTDEEEDPLSLAFLKDMDQIEFVIDTEEEEKRTEKSDDVIMLVEETKDQKEDENRTEKSDDDVMIVEETKDKEDSKDEDYIPEGTENANSANEWETDNSDGWETDNSDDVPLKKLRSSNTVPVQSTENKSTEKSPTKHDKHLQIDLPKFSNIISEKLKSKKGLATYTANFRKILPKTPSTSNKESTSNQHQPKILLNVLTTNHSNTSKVDASSSPALKIAGSSPALKIAGSSPALKIAGSSPALKIASSSNEVSTKIGQKRAAGVANVQVKAVVQPAMPAKATSGSNLMNMVLVPNPQEFTLEEDRTRINPCYVPGCKIYKNEQMYAFQVPKDKQTLQLWDMCINNKKDKLDFNHVICYKHFAQEDVIHNIKIVNKNGQDVALDEPKLRKGSWPCIKFFDKCCVPDCDKTTGRMYTFPVTNPTNLHLWLYLVKSNELKQMSVKDLLKHRVCEIHFEADSFDKDGDLTYLAAPTLFLPETQPPPLTKSQPIKDTFFKKCAFKNCVSQGNSTKMLFPFPDYFEGILRWLEACKRVDLIGATLMDTLPKLAYLAVCEDHFEPVDFENSGMDKLKKTAVPNPKLPYVSTKDDSGRKTNRIKLTPILLESCIYRGCKSKPAKENPFFSFPSDEDRYKQWMKACGYKCFGKHFYAYKICRDHFKQDMFDKEGNLKDSAVPHTYPDPKLIVSPIVQPKKCIIPEMTQQKIQSEGNVTTVLSINNEKEVVIIRDTSKTAENQKEIDQQDLICAVRSCVSMYKFSEGRYHRFPDPAVDPERFDIWVKLVANDNLEELSKEEIRRSYMVCKRHFEKRFFSKRLSPKQEKVLSDEAVPTLNLPANSGWLTEWDYYKVRLKKYLDILAAEAHNEEDEEIEHEISIEKPVTTSWLSTDTVRIDDLKDKTRCVLEKDRLSFPGMGCDLYVESSNKKSKFPYGVYRAYTTGYGLTNILETGENVHIHTAIVIDDDDECERKVLQQLIDRKKKLKAAALNKS